MAVTVAGSRASDSSAVTVTSTATPVASASGLRSVTVGSMVSTVIVRAADAGEVLGAASVALAVYTWTPSATPVRAMLQVPPVAVVVPLEVAPSNSSTVLPASAVPAIVRSPSRS